MTDAAKLSPLAGLARYRSHGDNETELVEALERARAVGVLNEYVKRKGSPGIKGDHTWSVTFFADHWSVKYFDELLGYANDPDDALVAAARNIEAGVAP